MMCLILAASLLSGFEIEKPKEPPGVGTLIAYYAGCRATDRVPTEIALSKGAMVKETNPLAPKSLEGRLAVDAISIVAMSLIDREISKKNPKAGKILRVILGAVHVGVGAHNISVAIKIGRK